jgi:hypothetical protein
MLKILKTLKIGFAESESWEERIQIFTLGVLFTRCNIFTPGLVITIYLVLLHLLLILLLPHVSSTTIKFTIVSWAGRQIYCPK